MDWTTYIGQTFVPEVTEVLSEISVDINQKSGGASARVWIDLYEASKTTGLPTTFKASSDPLEGQDLGGLDDGTWDHFVFATYQSLTPGELYAFALRTENDLEINYRRHTDGTKYVSDYPGSEGYGTRVWASSPTWQWNTTGDDLKFQTWHTPEPTAMVGLLSMGSLALVYSGLRRRARKRLPS